MCYLADWVAFCFFQYLLLTILKAFYNLASNTLSNNKLDFKMSSMMYLSNTIWVGGKKNRVFGNVSLIISLIAIFVSIGD